MFNCLILGIVEASGWFGAENSLASSRNGDRYTRAVVDSLLALSHHVEVKSVLEGVSVIK